MTMRRDVHDALRARLHEAAETHEPDRARILARLERGMSEEFRPDHRATRPPVFGWVRVVAATTAVAGVLGVGGYAVASAVKEDTPPQQVAVTATPTPSPDATSRAPAPPADPTPSRPPTSGAPSTSASPTPDSSVTARPPAASGTEDGPLWSDGSVDPHSNEFWAQSNVTLKTSRQLTALTVRLRVAQTGGVTSAGAWRSLPEDDFTLTVGEQDGFVVYTWVLKEGRTVAKGEWVFAGQYSHERGGRDAKDDSYAITARAGGEQRAVAGDFAAREGDEGDS
ncbi:hypothetical protein [Streptomyces resistomycificus]|uniref:Uncharacterized protein n=1 Tax=Streptomyces resistomycificus TaxID=67356 RepID=A0A0L8L6S6_9ACTN|nr:hypothetical protein [Streptomyces resistomycificus]KOG33857.1 hypothetical protein ADK37_21000 [Streptomyces resistomycificus]KUN91775.1 hypothetical protein AQJ84_35345 [Streptomyces resistomycificus]